MKIATASFLYGKERLSHILPNYLVSLRQWQTRPPDESWLAVEPTSPNDDTPEIAERCCAPFGVQVLRVEPRESDRYWNKCRAINHAIRATDSSIDIVMQIDLDMILHPKHMERALATFEENHKILYLCPNRSLTDEIVISNEFPEQQWGRLREISQYVPSGAELDPPKMANPRGVGPPSRSWGVCQGAQRKWWHLIRGYDECINGWGSDDGDIVRRAALHKREIVWAPDELLCYHQRHPRRVENVSDEERIARKVQARKNRYWSYQQYFFRRIKRNPDEWGGIKRIKRNPDERGDIKE